MNTIVFPIECVGPLAAGTYVRADEARARITELEKQLSRYQSGVEVEGFITVQHGLILSSASTHKIQTSLPCGIVKVLVMKEVE